MNGLTKPARLRPGATIGVAALSGAVEPAKLDRGIAYLRRRGYRVLEASNLRSVDRSFAGSDEERALGYRELLRDPGVEAIFFARGGWGAARVLSRLDPGEVRAHPKIHMGGSDLASLFSFLQNSCGQGAFHGPMIAVDFAREPVDPETDSTWEPALRGEVPLEVPLEPRQVAAPGSGAGPLVGGCLSILVSLEGTPEAIRTDGCVLFWEDVREEIYRLDRMLAQLRRAGKLARLSGVIIGQLESITRDGKPDEESVTGLLCEHFAGAGYPVVRDWPAGHARRNRAMALGARVEIDTARKAVRFVEAGVL